MVTYAGRKASPFTSVRVLRIAHASVLNRLNPLFGMEGTNPSALKKSVELLETEKADIVALYNERDKKLLEGVLYPTAFLASLARTEEKRQTFIAAPSGEGAFFYYQKLGLTLKEYERYIEQSRSVYERFPDETYAFLGGESSPEKYLLAFAELESAAMGKNAELKKRKACVRRFSANCPSLSAAFQKLRYTAPLAMTPPEDAPPLVMEHKAILDAVHAALDVEFSPKDCSAKTEKVLVRTPAGVCEGRALGDTAFYEVQWEKGALSPDKDMRLTYLNDIYIFDITYENSLYHKLLKEKGSRYLDKSIENFYLCPDVGSRYVEFSTIAALRDLLQDVPLSKAPLGETFKTLEDHIVSAEVIQSENVSAYIATLSNFLTKKGEGVATELLGETWVMRAESILSMYRTQSGYFNAFIPLVTSRNKVIKRTASVGVRPSVSTLLATRNAPLLFLLAYNTSIIGTPPRLLKPTPFNQGKAHLLSYERDFKAWYTPEETLELFIHSKRTTLQMDKEGMEK